MNDGSSRGPSILIIDDADPFGRSLQESLTDAGYTVRRAAYAHEEQVELVAANADLILLSLMLPGTNGLMLCARLKARTSAEIVVFSDRSREVDRALALELGAVAVLTRPSDIDTVLARFPSASKPAGARV